MKNIKFIYSKIILLSGLLLATAVSCERDISDEAEFATNSVSGDIFTDTFIGMGTNFYFPFVGDGAKPDVFSVDENQGYESNASIRIDVPNSNDPGGNFAGFSFVVDGAGRNLTQYDALTFWAKSSQSVNIGVVGFGESKYQALRSGLDFTTNWTKFIVPIPDPSKLIEEKGMFLISAGGILDVGADPDTAVRTGYTFWLDEIKFEKLGTLAQPNPAILNGVDVVEQSFVGSTILPEDLGLTQTFNLESGLNQTVSAAPSYFTFESSDIEVARVSELGVVSVLGSGTVVITANMGGVKALGSLTLEVLGNFVGADTPPARDPGDVISIFSDAYTNVNQLNFAVFNDADVQVETLDFNGNQVARYNTLGFVGLGWEGTVDVSTMTHLHIDIQVSESVDPTLIIELIDFGANDSDGGGDDTGGGSAIAASELIEGTWVGIDIPINGFTQGTGGGFLGSPNLNNIARVVLVSNDSSFIVDNIYFYKEI